MDRSGLAAGGVGVLPWEWFDFAAPLRVLRGLPLDIERGGALVGYGVEFDGRVIPFKVLRREAGDGAQGRGRGTVVMLHGMGLNIASFHGVAGYLLAMHDLVLIDYTSFAVGGGASGSAAGELGRLFDSGRGRDAHETAGGTPALHLGGWPRGGVSMKVLTESVWRVIDALGLERVSLVGNSLGGGMCLVAALQQPGRVERMVLVNPACYPQGLPLMYRVARVPLLGEAFMALTAGERFVAGVELIGYADKGRFAPELRARYLRQLNVRANRFRLMDMIRHLPGNARDTAGAGHLGRLGEIGQPVLLLWGEKDPLLVAESGPRLARELLNCRFEVLADLAHMPHEEAPERVGPMMAEFLASGQ